MDASAWRRRRLIAPAALSRRRRSPGRTARTSRAASPRRAPGRPPGCPASRAPASPWRPCSCRCRRSCRWLPVLPVSAGVGVGVGVPGGRRGRASASRRRRDVGGALLVRHAQHRRRARDLLDGGVIAAAARRDERKAEKRQQKGGAEPAHGGGGQRGSAAMRRPQTGQSLRSFCASWSHQLQKRRFSMAHGSWDFDGAQRQNLADDLERLARLAVDVGAPRLGLEQDLAAGRGRAKSILLAHCGAQTSSGAGDPR